MLTDVVEIAITTTRATVTTVIPESKIQSTRQQDRVVVDSIMRDDPPDKTTTVSVSHPYPCVATEECAATEVPEAPVEVEALPTKTNLDASTTTRIAAPAEETTMTRSLPTVRDKIVVDTVVAAVVDTSEVACAEVLSAPIAQNDLNAMNALSAQNATSVQNAQIGLNALIWDHPPVEDVEDAVTTMVTQDRAETTSMFPFVANTNKMILAVSSVSAENDLPPTARTMATVKSPDIAVECAVVAAEATMEAATESMATRENLGVLKHYPITTANLEVAVETMTVQAQAVEATTMVQAEEVAVEVTTMVPTEVVAEATSTMAACAEVAEEATTMAPTEAVVEATLRTVCVAAMAVAGSVDEVAEATIATSTTTTKSPVNMALTELKTTARGKIISKEDTTMVPVEPTVETLETITTMTAVTANTETSTEDVAAAACVVVEAATSMALTEEATPMEAIGPAIVKTTTSVLPHSKSLRDPAPIAEAEVTCSCVVVAEVVVAEILELLAAEVTSAEAEETSEEEEISEATKAIQEVVPIWVVAEAMETKSSSTPKSESAHKAGSSRRDIRDEAASIRKSDDAPNAKRPVQGGRRVPVWDEISRVRATLWPAAQPSLQDKRQKIVT